MDARSRRLLIRITDHKAYILGGEGFADFVTLYGGEAHIDILEGKVIRIGHMGENCNMEDVNQTLKALGEVLHQ